MAEEWRRYKDTGYEVSRSGKVRSINTHKEVGYEGAKGYVLIRQGRKGSTVKRNVMVAQTFMDWYDGCEIHHKNGNPKDDRVENLLVCTPLQHQRIHNRCNITVQFDKEWNVVAAYNSIADADESVNGCKHLFQNSISRNQNYKGFRWIVLKNLPENLIFVDENVSYEKERALNELVQLIGTERSKAQFFKEVESPPISTKKLSNQTNLPPNTTPIALEVLRDLHFS